jgi:hypothetical protein
MRESVKSGASFPASIENRESMLTCGFGQFRDDRESTGNRSFSPFDAGIGADLRFCATSPKTGNRDRESVLTCENAQIYAKTVGGDRFPFSCRHPPSGRSAATLATAASAFGVRQELVGHQCVELPTHPFL